MKRPRTMPHIVDDLTRREFLVGAGLIALAPSCGDGSGSGEGSSGETRRVEHEMGVSEVPLAPGRVVTLWEPAFSALVSLGIEPVASIGDPADRRKGLGRMVPDGYDLSDVELVGSQGEPDLESIAALEPDMIVGISALDEPVYEQLSQVAPTVSFDWGPGTGDWKGYFDEVAAAAGRREEGRRVVEEYERRAAEVGDGIGDPESIEVSTMRVFPDTLILDARNSFSGAIIEDVGLSRPPSQDITPEDQRVEMSLELLPDADGDVMFIMVPDDGGESEEFFDEMTSNPLWERLDVVQRDEVYTVDYRAWQASNYHAANLVLDDLEKYLTR